MFEDILKFFKSLFSAKNKKKKSFSVFIAIVCFLILIPIVFAIFYSYFYDSSSLLTTNEIQLELYDSAGKLTASDNVIEANLADSPLISVFNKLNLTKEQIAKPSNFEKDPTFKVIIKFSNKTEEFFCYFTDSSTNSFIKSKNGDFFSVNADAYTAFLNSAYSESVYPEAAPPALVTGNGETVRPASVQWHYKKKNGRTASATLCATTSEVLTYKIGGAINLEFQKLFHLWNVLAFQYSTYTDV